MTDDIIRKKESLKARLKFSSKSIVNVHVCACIVCKSGGIHIYMYTFVNDVCIVHVYNPPLRSIFLLYIHVQHTYT